MMHKAALKTYERTKGMTFDEKLAYWEERNKACRKALKQNTGKDSSKRKEYRHESTDTCHDTLTVSEF